MNLQTINEGDAVQFLREKDVLIRFPFSRSQLWAMVKRGDFPAPVKLSERCTAWALSDLAVFADKLKGGSKKSGGAK
jgi:prophage regulatory protein